MKLYYLYKITNTINEKIYIGVTSQPEQRKKAHFFNRSQKFRSLIKNAIDKYGAENFNFEVVCIGGLEYIYELENRAVGLYDTLSPNGYNILPGGLGGVGHKVEKKINDVPVFVSGFWFPAIRFAVSSLKIPRSTIHDRLRKGVAGEVYRKSDEKILVGMPVYVGSFWFPCIKLASSSLVKPAATLRKRIREGFVGEKEKPKQLPGEDSRLFGMKGSLCVNSIPIKISEVEYQSITQASELTGFSASRISKLLKSDNPDFNYIKV